MLNHDFIKRKVKLIQEDLLELKKYETLTAADFSSNTTAELVIERLLEQIITRAIDINQHCIAELGRGKEKVRTYEDTFLIMAELKFYPHVFAQKIAPSAGLRNILVHEYDELDSNLVYQSMKKALREYPQYCQYLLKFLNAHRHDRR